MTNHVPQKVPEHFSRADIGAYMRELRLHYGLTEQDVSQRLHIRLKYVTAIETANFDAMPGKAYARGYVHTYAEFLGLDADQVVERCFGGEMAREVQAHSIPESSNWYKRNKAYGGVLAVLLLLGGLFYVATRDDTATGTETAEVSEGVESVPEEYLASMRTRLMPTAKNYDCLGNPSLLGCYRSQRLTREWTVPAPAPVMAPAPASAYEDTVAEDEKDEVDEKADDAKKETKSEPKTEVKKEAKPDPKKKKEAENKKFPGMPADYKGYYVPPKPAPAPEPVEPEVKPAKPETKPAAQKADEPKNDEPKADDTKGDE